MSVPDEAWIRTVARRVAISRRRQARDAEGAGRAGWRDHRFLRPRALLMVLLLLGVGIQAWQLARLETRVTDGFEADLRHDLYAQEGVDALEEQISMLEQANGLAFGPEAFSSHERTGSDGDLGLIYEVVVPSVFEVEAGHQVGIAFAVGAGTTDGGTNLLTTYDLVEHQWALGFGQVWVRTHRYHPSLEGNEILLEAVIMDVYEAADLAWLQVDARLDPLNVASEPARPGQEVAVVGIDPSASELDPFPYDREVGRVRTADRADVGAATELRVETFREGDGFFGSPVINPAYEVVGIATGLIPADPGAWNGYRLAQPIDVACARFEVC